MYAVFNSECDLAKSEFINLEKLLSDTKEHNI